MSDDALDRWLSSRLDSLHDSLDDVLDLKRGLADATLPRAHAELVSDLGEVLDLDAGLSQVVSPLLERTPRPVEQLAAVADEVTALPVTKRLAVLAWLPRGTLRSARNFTIETLRARVIHDPSIRTIVRAAIGEPEQSIGNLLKPFGHRLSAADLVHQLADAVTDRLLLAIKDVRLTGLDVSLAGRLANGLTNAASAHTFYTGHDMLAMEIALLRALDQILGAVTDMVGADLTWADLRGVPLGGVRWSPDTQWPQEWQEWVRINSDLVSDGVFEIRAGSTGINTDSYLPT